MERGNYGRKGWVMHSKETIDYENTNFTSNFEVYLLRLNRIYMPGQWDEG